MSAPPFAAPRLPRELRVVVYLLNHAPRRGKLASGSLQWLQLGRNLSACARLFHAPMGSSGELQPAAAKAGLEKFRASLTWKVPNARQWLAGSSVNGAPQVEQGRSRMWSTDPCTS